MLREAEEEDEIMESEILSDSEEVEARSDV